MLALPSAVTKPYQAGIMTKHESYLHNTSIYERQLACSSQIRQTTMILGDALGEHGVETSSRVLLVLASEPLCWRAILKGLQWDSLRLQGLLACCSHMASLAQPEVGVPGCMDSSTDPNPPADPCCPSQKLIPESCSSDACCALLRCTADEAAALKELPEALGYVADLTGGPRRDMDLAGCRRAEGGWTEPDPSSG